MVTPRAMSGRSLSKWRRRSGDIERDDAGGRAGAAARVEQCLSQRAGAGVIGIADSDAVVSDCDGIAQRVVDEDRIVLIRTDVRHDIVSSAR